MGDAVMPHVISNWHPFKVMLRSKDVIYLTNSCCRCSFILTSLPAAVKMEELKKEWEHMINILCFHVCFHSFTLQLCFGLFGLLHISVSSLPVFTFLSLYYICSFSFSLNLLPLCTIATSPSPLLLSDIFSKLRSEASCCCLIWAVSSVLITTRRDRNGLGRVCVH